MIHPHNNDGMQVPVIFAAGSLWVRISAQIFNCLDDYVRLADVVHALMKGP